MGCFQSKVVATCTGPVQNPNRGAKGTLTVTRPQGKLPKNREVFVEHSKYGRLISHTTQSLSKVPLKVEVPEGVGEGETFELAVEPPTETEAAFCAPASRRERKETEESN